MEARMRRLGLIGLVSAVILPAGPAQPGVPAPEGRVVHLCPDSRRAEGERCIFGFGPGRRLGVPWSVLEAPRTVRQNDPRISTYGTSHPNGLWPLGICHPANACEPTVGASGRRQPLPGQEPRISEQWSLCGRRLPDGTVEHRTDDVTGKPCTTPTAPAEPLNFALSVTTGSASSTVGFARSLAKAEDRTVELFRRCYPRNVPVQMCEVHGGRDGLAFTIFWQGRPDVASEAIFAAAADLFDRYVIEGPGMAH
jgi:hypothetical protein